ncbi:DsbA family protein [Paracoccus sp. TK19116]|uniref:DsbA family protein n=1 Tax=Paracoccus albicereus TaxID=2922394 RepID=A0ABT1MRC4_9RHOB|nr:DsbA family protein [Paracoccus albicereus]MCQ0970865.1 DsbA family protein [Paracoccus albicereus]
MHSRREILIGASLACAATTLSARAQSADRPNPMPEELRKDLERDPTAPVLGNPEGDITLTEFFDYNCPFCREMVPVVQQLIATDPELRVVYREWPVFGEGSDFAARASLASLDQGKYWAFHVALMQMDGRAEEPTVLRVAEKVGLDLDKLQQDMESQRVIDHVGRSMSLGDHMQLMGTPTFICGDEAVFGKQSLSDLKALVARGRATMGVSG